MSDEDKMIKKLEEHKNAKKMIVEIGAANGIKVIETENNNPNGDFMYEEKDHKKLVQAIDEYLHEYKYEKDIESDEK